MDILVEQKKRAGPKAAWMDHQSINQSIFFCHETVDVTSLLLH